MKTGFIIPIRYYHHSDHYGQDHGYGILLMHYSTGNLIENNVFDTLALSVALEGGSSGNVVAYTYNHHVEYTNDPELQQTSFGSHGAHPYMNLFEGNVVKKVQHDNYWGSASHMVWFRNELSAPETQFLNYIYPVVLDADNRYMSFVGNVLGVSSFGYGAYEMTGATNLACYWHTAGAIYKLGYYSGSSDCAWDPLDDPEVATTLLRHGNYDFFHDDVVWDASIADHVIPASYYLTSKPAFFGCRPWPAVGPDLTPMVGSLPAKDRFDGVDPCAACTDLDSDGYGSPASAACAHPELDCSDADVNVHPTATESCNGRDDDCNNATDELWPTLGGACTAGVGACSATGAYVCTPDGSNVACDATPGAPSLELCGNTIDEDCDGALDNGCACAAGDTRPCYAGPAGTEDVGACNGGAQSCEAGVWDACEGQVLPGVEVCDNGLDDDCDRMIDVSDTADCPGPLVGPGPAVGKGCDCGVVSPGGALWAVALAWLARERRRRVSRRLLPGGQINEGSKRRNGCAGLVGALLLTWPLSGRATTINVVDSMGQPSCEQADVQAAVAAAADGDRVVVPAGSCQWSAAVTFSNKAIAVEGSAMDPTTITLVGGANAFRVTGQDGKPFRISGFTFTGVSAYAYPSGVINIVGSCKNWRVDHCKFTGLSSPAGCRTYGILASGYTYGLIDHNLFTTQPGGYLQAVAVSGEDALAKMSGNSAWMRPLTLGSANAVYVEDNTWDFTNQPCSGTSGGNIDGNNGMRIVTRYNSIKNIYHHGHSACASGGRGTFSWEIYNNSFENTGGTSFSFTAIWPRGGTGVIFNNTIAGTYTYPIIVDNQRDCASPCSGPLVGPACDGTSPWDANQPGQGGYYCLDQIGRSTGDPTNQQLAPVYEWSNTYNGVPTHISVQNLCAGSTLHTQENRDFYAASSGTLAQMPATCTPYNSYFATDAGKLYKCASTDTWSEYYTPYTYPHPLAAAPVPCGSNGCEVSLGETCENCPQDCGSCCGNGVLDAGETCDPPSSCPMSCDDGDACTADTLLGSAPTCTAGCAHAATTACDSGDGCCPTGCSGANDNDCPPPCVDADLDGYGNPASTTCVHPELDCDDTSAAVNPGAAEVKNGIDDDCDGEVDEGFGTGNDEQPTARAAGGCACSAREEASAGLVLAFLGVAGLRLRLRLRRAAGPRGRRTLVSFQSLLLLVACAATPRPAAATVVNAASCSQADVQDAVTAASDGDTIVVPGPSCTWTVSTAVPAVNLYGKQLIVQGAGVDSSIITLNHSVSCLACSAIYTKGIAGKPFSIAGFTFDGTAADAVLKVDGDCKNWRIHHNRFRNTTGRSIWIKPICTDRNCQTYGLIDHNEFDLLGQGIFLQVQDTLSAAAPMGMGPWAEDTNLGTAEAIYIEDNTWNFPPGNTRSIIDCDAGGKFVFRHNVGANAQIHAHGGGDSPGADWWDCRRGCRKFEIYNNTLSGSTTSNWAIQLRAGTGVIFDNILTGTYMQSNCSSVICLRCYRGEPSGTHCDNWMYCDGANVPDGNNPSEAGRHCRDCAGVGKDVSGVWTQTGSTVLSSTVQQEEPVYVWNNTYQGSAQSAGTTSSRVYIGTDVINSQKPGYVPYTYPHPLTVPPQGPCEAAAGACCGEGQLCQAGAFVNSNDCGAKCCVGGTCQDPAICADTDGDGYGNPALAACAHPELDCNDGDASIFPAALEICGDGIDQDCSGADLACTCGNSVCDTGEDCSSCPLDCLTGVGQKCCGGALVTGNCCSVSDCADFETCTGNVCVALADGGPTGGDSHTGGGAIRHGCACEASGQAGDLGLVAWVLVGLAVSSRRRRRWAAEIELAMDKGHDCRRAALLFVVPILLAPEIARAACGGSSPNLVSASCSDSDINDCVVAAIDGDTINVPEGSCTWTAAGLGHPAIDLAGKAIKLIGAGNGPDISVSCGYGWGTGPEVAIRSITTAGRNPRISNFHFSGTASAYGVIRTCTATSPGCSTRRWAQKSTLTDLWAAADTRRG